MLRYQRPAARGLPALPPMTAALRAACLCWRLPLSFVYVHSGLSKVRQVVGGIRGRGAWSQHSGRHARGDARQLERSAGLDVGDQPRTGPRTRAGPRLYPRVGQRGRVKRLELERHLREQMPCFEALEDSFGDVIGVQSLQELKPRPIAFHSLGTCFCSSTAFDSDCRTS